jgi:hypothetical protein
VLKLGDLFQVLGLARAELGTHFGFARIAARDEFFYLRFERQPMLRPITLLVRERRRQRLAPCIK